MTSSLFFGLSPSMTFKQLTFNVVFRVLPLVAGSYERTGYLEVITMNLLIYMNKRAMQFTV